MERETLETDVLVVGAGPAGLAFAIQLARLCKEDGLEKSILVIDKAAELGRHQLSGAVVDPHGVLELFPHAREEGFPIQAEVGEDALWKLGPRGKKVFRGALCPPPFRNEGNWIVALSEVVPWMAARAEELGVEVYPGFAAAEVVEDSQGAVIGVRTVDQGRDKNGAEKSNFQPGMEIRALVTVLAEGPRGSLAKQLIRSKGLDAGRSPQLFGVGVKELWEVPDSHPGRVIHTAGWPLRGIYGGGWIYGLPENRLSIGFVVGMDHGDPSFDYHAAMQIWKSHPAVRALLEGGKLLSYGAKTVPEGGLLAMPRLCGDGFLLLGDSAGFLNAQRLKGIHLALKSGMLAAAPALRALQEGEASAELLEAYPQAFRDSWAHRELWKVRNFRQAFQRGFLYGAARGGLDFLLGGRLPGTIRGQSDHERYRSGVPSRLPEPNFDGQISFDKLTSVYHSGTAHEEDQPGHLLIGDPSLCTERCTAEFGNPCQHFCPAGVYEWHGEDGLRINASNCVHCKTCDIADPYQTITWTVPESGGPGYAGM